MKIEKSLVDLFEMFQNILKNLAGDNARVSNLDILPEVEVDLLQSLDTIDFDFTEDLTIADLFERQVSKNPGQVALLNETGSLTYQELNERANGLAHHLREIGIVPESRVAILLEPGFDTVVAILGVMKSGGAFVPLDPKSPVERIAFQLEDSGCKVLISAGNLPNDIGLTTASLEVINVQDLPELGKENLAKVSSASNLAYIIYTSGSTGRPKGVMVEHAGAFNAINWRAKEYQMDETDRILLLLNYVFDGFLLTLFTPLSSGSAVYIHEKASVMDARDLARIIGEFKITQMSLMPALYSVILDEMQEGNPYYMRQVTLAGEAIDLSVIEKSQRILPHVELSDEYGPTENSIVSTAFRHLSTDQTISIGKPIENTGVCILNRAGDIQAVGVPGEICLYGIGLARGYLNNPELTNEKFVNHPYLPGTRLYKTGDLGRWLKDGNIEFLGRIDSQVKIRGFRVELGEIEAQLNQLACLREAVVNYDTNTQLLIAYYIADNQPESGEIQAELAERLPYYMVPSHFVRLDKIPLTKIGKLDKQALPPIERSLEENRDEPTNNIQQSLIQIWSDVLGVQENAIGTNMNFFDLGGNSINLMQMVNQVNARFEKNIPVAKVFSHPDIGALSALIAENGVPVIELQNVSDEDISERDDLLDLFTRG